VNCSVYLFNNSTFICSLFSKILFSVFYHLIAVAARDTSVISELVTSWQFSVWQREEKLEPVIWYIGVWHLLHVSWWQLHIPRTEWRRQCVRCLGQWPCLWQRRKSSYQVILIASDLYVVYGSSWIPSVLWHLVRWQEGNLACKIYRGSSLRDLQRIQPLL